MALKCVNLDADVYLVCLAHALSTEREEVMGLLIGEIDEKHVMQLYSVIILRRSDKQPDRVEISPEQQSDAAVRAERMAQELNCPMRVVGWYHSHPHITVWPSHVDVRTQANYQQMDKGFVGLIFSVFNEDKATKQNRIQVTCFQSIDINSQFERVEVPLNIVPKSSISRVCLNPLVEMPRILLDEEDEMYDKMSGEGSARDNLLTSIHNASVYTKSVCNVLDTVTAPLTHSLDQHLAQNTLRIKHLKEEKDMLLARLKGYEERTLLD